MKTAYLFIDGLSSEQTQEVTKLLSAINRISARSRFLHHHWEVGQNPTTADAFYIGKDTNLTPADYPNKPYLGDTYLVKHHNLIHLPLPFTVMDGIRAFEEIEAIIANQAYHNQNTTSSQQKTNEDNNTQAQSSLSFQAFCSHPLPDSAVLIGGDDIIAYDKASNRLLSNAANQEILFDWLISQKTFSISLQPFEQIAEGNLNHFILDAVLWRYGLYAPISPAVSAHLDADKNRFHLKKWPLFGRWKTHSQYLMLTSIFTSAPTSLKEAQQKSNLAEAPIMHFLAAAYLAGLPIEISPNQKDDLSVSQRQNVVWVDQLREKLNMNNSLT